MLEQMRKGAQHLVVKIMFFLLAAMFVLWGVGDVFRNNVGDGYVAKIGKSGVSAAELENMVRVEIEKYQRATGKTLTEAEIEQSDVKKYVLGQLVRDKITMMRAEDLNITGGKKDIASHIDQNQVFFDEQGKFDKVRFKEILRTNGFTEEKFISAIKNEAAVSNLMGSLASKGIAVDVIAKAVFSYRSEKRVADIITVPVNIITDIADPADTDLVQFYQENQDSFSVPEQRSASYISFNSEKIKSGIKLSDEELKSAYDANIQQYKIDATRDVSQYLFSSEEEAKAAYEKISKGDVKGFATSKIELGKVSESSVPVQVKDAIFTLKEKEASQPVKSDLGWHIFIVNSTQAEKVKSFEEVKKDIEKELLEKKASDEFSKYGNQVEDEFAAGKKMEDIAKAFDLVVHKIPSVDINGNSESGGKVSIPDQETTLPLIFSLDSGGAHSSLTLLSDNSTYVIFRVDEVLARRVKALDEVRGLAIKAWKDSQKVKLLKEKAAEIASKLRAGEDYKVLISKMNLKLEESKNLSRYSDESDAKNILAEELRRELFYLKKQGVFTNAYMSHDGSFAIARLVKVNTTKPENDKQAYKDIQAQLEEEMRDDILVQYTNFLRAEYPVSIKDGVVGGEK